jgi:prepilin-type N-terminal cleavage/methylation domain-containing protein
LLGSRRCTESKKIVMKAKASAQSGFTLVEIMIVVAIIGLLAAIAIPNFARARSTTQKNACINNLRQIDGAAQLWALEFGKTSSETYQLNDIVPYLIPHVSAVPTCPAGGNYVPSTVGVPPTCSLPTTLGHVMQ